MSSPLITFRYGRETISWIKSSRSSSVIAFLTRPLEHVADVRKQYRPPAKRHRDAFCSFSVVFVASPSTLECPAGEEQQPLDLIEADVPRASREPSPEFAPFHVEIVTSPLISGRGRRHPPASALGRASGRGSSPPSRIQRASRGVIALVNRKALHEGPFGRRPLPRGRQSGVMDTSLFVPFEQPATRAAENPPATTLPAGVSAPLGRGLRLWQLLSLTALLAFAAGGAAGGVTGSWVDDGPQATSSTPSNGESMTAATAGVDLPALIAGINRSVVAIDVTSRAQIGTRGQTVTSESYGTGFVLSADGLIATAAHVVEDAVIIKVTMPDGSWANGTLVGQDTGADLAVIRVAREGLRPVAFDSSAGLRPGEMIVVVGNALALQGGLSATLGIVSATGRTITTSDRTTYTGLIQVDAAINSGDSGGPLVNAAGLVVGVNTAAVKADAGNSVGFAIPIDVAAPILLELAGIKR
ncbi:MAG: hypothetical protein C0506_02900 [Anaerolinea sp.]|nr:hypothetical protein [Anaerolinea sp.]